MKKQRKLDLQTMEYAITGGTILGGGGGGAAQLGRRFAEIAVAYSDLYLWDIDDISETDTVLTVSMVGAPSAPDQYISPEQMIRTVELVKQNSEVNIGGIITNENGGFATINGWLQSAMLGIPLLDAPCNGRAHPTGVMGSMNLHKIPEYRTIQGAVGGNSELHYDLECMLKGSIDTTSNLVRSASVEAGGVVGVARNPVTAAYAKEHAAIGGISHAIEVGEVFHKGMATSVDYAIHSVMEFLNGEVVAKDIVSEYTIATEGGYDIGSCRVGDIELVFWNEYMTLDKNGERIATFPELIMTFDAKTGDPLPTSDIKQGMEVYVVYTGMENLKLSSTMFEADLIAQVEEIIGREMLKYLNLERKAAISSL